MLQYALRFRPCIPSLLSKISRRQLSDVEPSSSHHSSLLTFLSHARSANLSPKSSVYNGTLYEYLCLETLSSPSYGFSLTRVGQRNDAGVDLIGEWTPPVSVGATRNGVSGEDRFPFPLRVLIQCKSSGKKLSPNVVRELEGCVAGAPAGWRGEHTLAVLCAKREASKGVRDAVRDAGMGVVWIMIEPVWQQSAMPSRAFALDDTAEEEKGGGEEMNLEGTKIPIGRVRQMLWNRRAADVGLEAVKVCMSYVKEESKGDMEREVKLMGIRD